MYLINYLSKKSIHDENIVKSNNKLEKCIDN